jgi:hypothetical protein
VDDYCDSFGSLAFGFDWAGRRWIDPCLVSGRGSGSINSTAFGATDDCLKVCFLVFKRSDDQFHCFLLWCFEVRETASLII